MSNNNWITDRPPTKDEVPDRCRAFTTDGAGRIAIHCGEVMRGWWRRPDRDDNPIAWMMPPEPFVPEVDTSLAASIERAGMFHLAFYVDGVPASDDLSRIVDAAKKWIAAMEKNEERPDLNGRLPIVYNGKSAEEWYMLYSQLLLKNTSDSIKAEFPPKFGPTPETVADVARSLEAWADSPAAGVMVDIMRSMAKKLRGDV